MTPTDQACHEVAHYMRRKRATVTLGATTLQIGLSGIANGLDNIARGNAEEGMRLAQHGLDFLNERIKEAQL